MLTKLLSIDKNTYEGNIFTGTVVDNNDPLKLERVKVSVTGLYEGDTTLFPWCVSFKRMFFGSGSGYGEFGVPRQGSKVAVMLQHGDPHFPIYLGAILQSGNPVAEAATNYPNRYGFKDPVGNLFYIDMTSGEVKFQHKSGTTITIANNGDVTVTAVGNVTETITGNLAISAGGTINITATGNMALTAARIDLNQ